MPTLNRFSHSLLLSISSFFIVFFIIVGFLSCSKAPTTDNKIKGIKVGIPQRRDFVESIPFLGKVESAKAVDVIVFEQARVEEVVARDGARVNKGDILFRLGGPVLDQKLSSARSEMNSAERELALAKEILERKKVSAQEKLVDKNELASREADVALKESALSSSSSRFKTLMEQAVLRAPVSGIFTDRKVNIGQDISPGDDLAEITSPEALRISALIYGIGPASLEGLKALIMAEGKEISAEVIKSFPERTVAGGMIVWLQPKDNEEILRPGLAVSGHLIFHTKKNQIALPTSALVFDDNETPYIFVAEADGKSFKKTRVKVGIVNSEWVEILEGLDEKDNVAVEGAYSLYYKQYAETTKVED